jgi:hypothetical protein
MIDIRTMVDRPNRRPFLGVAYRLPAGFILWRRAGLAGRAANAWRRSSCARAGVVYARRYSLGGRRVVEANYQASKAFTANASRPDVN